MSWSQPSAWFPGVVKCDGGWARSAKVVPPVASWEMRASGGREEGKGGVRRGGGRANGGGGEVVLRFTDGIGVEDFDTVG